jgi:hypothetical protein
MSELEKALVNVVNGDEEVCIRFEQLDLESVRRLMAACSTASSNLKKLSFLWCGLDTEAALLIASSLRSNSVLTCLSLTDTNGIGPRVAQAIAEMVCVNVVLKILWLYGCSVGDKGAGHLAMALRRNSSLEEVALGNNGITYVGTAAITTVLPLNQSLKFLDLRHNPLGKDGVEALAKAVPCSGLRRLWLHGARFGQRGCATLVEMLRNGSQLRQLGTDEDHWTALDEGFHCNGWLLEDAPKPYLERNKAMHLQARKSVYTLLLIRKLQRTALSSFPKEVVREIAQFLYSSRGEVSVWQENKQ